MDMDEASSFRKMLLDELNAVRQHWLDETEDSDFDAEDGLLSESEHDSASEIEEDSEDEDWEAPSEPNVYYGKQQCYKWTAEPCHKEDDINNITPSLKTQVPPEPLKIFELFLNDDLLEELVKWTNVRLNRMRCKSSHRAKNFYNVDVAEMRALIGLLMYTGNFHHQLEYLNVFDGFGPDIFPLAMDSNRFGVLLLALRFDNPLDVAERKESDPTAPISRVFNRFVRNCQQVYNPGGIMCVDEMFVDFRGKCRFKERLPDEENELGFVVNDRDMYALKIMCMTDAKTRYLYNAYIHTGKSSDSSLNMPKNSKCVLDLAQPIYQTGRNVTADSWFASIPLALELKSKGLTFVGPLKIDNKEIPKEFLPKKKITKTIYGFSKELSMVSIMKKGRSSILISSMHLTKSNDKNPSILQHYNDAKGGVEKLNKACAKAPIGHKSSKWALDVFFRLLNIAKHNSRILYQLCNDKGAKQYKKSTWYKFDLEIAFALVSPHLLSRLSQVNLAAQSRIRKILKLPDPNKVAKDCTLCPPEKKSKATDECSSCSALVCEECSVAICDDCSEQPN